MKTIPSAQTTAKSPPSENVKSTPPSESTEETTSALNNYFVISNLTYKPVKIAFAGHPLTSKEKMGIPSTLDEAYLYKKLKEYDDEIGKIGVQNIFATTKSDIISIIDQIQVPEGMYTFSVRTATENCSYFFDSRLEYFPEKGARQMVESKSRQIWFLIPQDIIKVPILSSESSVSKKTKENIRSSQTNRSFDEDQEEEDEEEEAESETRSSSTLSIEERNIILGKVKIFSLIHIPSEQYYIRKILLYDRDIGIPEAIESYKKRNEIKGNEKVSRENKLRGKVSIVKRYPQLEGVYEFKIFNKPKKSDLALFFRSQMRYFVNTESEVEDRFVSGSMNRPVLEETISK